MDPKVRKCSHIQHAHKDLIELTSQKSFTTVDCSRFLKYIGAKAKVFTHENHSNSQLG